MSEHWPSYRSHKVVRAHPITDIRSTQGAAFCGTQAFVPSVATMLDKAKIGDYAVVYRDGYRSISPKKEFEDGYVLIQLADWQERVIEERGQLVNRLNKLNEALDSGRVPAGAGDVLHRQRAAMGAYLAVLNERIAAFG